MLIGIILAIAGNLGIYQWAWNPLHGILLFITGALVTALSIGNPERKEEPDQPQKASLRLHKGFILVIGLVLVTLLVPAVCKFGELSGYTWTAALIAILVIFLYGGPSQRILPAMPGP